MPTLPIIKRFEFSPFTPLKLLPDVALRVFGGLVLWGLIFLALLED